MAANLVNDDDTGVPELGSGSCLAQKSSGLLDCRQLAGVGKLDGDRSVEFLIVRPPNSAESSGADLFQQLKAAELASLIDQRLRTFPVYLKRTAASRTEDFVRTMVIYRNDVVAVRTVAQGHVDRSESEDSRILVTMSRESTGARR